MRIAVLPALTPATYQRHALHGEGTAWPEKNCYADLWIGFLHTLGLEPLAMLPFTVAVDFEDDQWTFFKPPLEDLRALYGVDVQELTVWRPLLEHAKEHLAAGRLISTEARTRPSKVKTRPRPKTPLQAWPIGDAPPRATSR